MHLFLGLDYAFSKDFVLSITFRGISRIAMHTPSRALPVTPSILVKISRTIDYVRDPLSCTLFCAFLFSFFLMARLANIVPKSSKSFDRRRNITRGDVRVIPSGLLITFKATKTIQFGERKLNIPLVSIPGSPLCPVSAYARMLQLIPAPSCSPLFVIPGHTSNIYTPLTSSRFVSEFRQCLKTAGIAQHDYFSGHSFRRGAASWAFNNGVPGEIIQLYGDWTSDAYKAYLEFSHQSKLSLAHLVRNAILKE